MGGLRLGVSPLEITNAYGKTSFGVNGVGTVLVLVRDGKVVGNGSIEPVLRDPVPENVVDSLWSPGETLGGAYSWTTIRQLSVPPPPPRFT